MVIWFKRRLPAATRANVKALFDADSYHLPQGTGRLLGRAKANDATFDALAAFRDEHRGNGLEAIP